MAGNPTRNIGWLVEIVSRIVLRVLDGVGCRRISGIGRPLFAIPSKVIINITLVIWFFLPTWLIWYVRQFIMISLEPVVLRQKMPEVLMDVGLKLLFSYFSQSMDIAFSNGPLTI